MAGAAMGAGNVAGNYLAGALRNPSAAASQTATLFIGMAFAETLGIFSFLVALLLLFAVRSLLPSLRLGGASCAHPIVKRPAWGGYDQPVATDRARRGRKYRNGGLHPESAAAGHMPMRRGWLMPPTQRRPCQPGMPQLDGHDLGSQIFWLLVVLAVIYWVLSRIALPRIGGVISDRQGAITGDLMAAEEES